MAGARTTVGISEAGLDEDRVPLSAGRFRNWSLSGRNCGGAPEDPSARLLAIS